MSGRPLPPKERINITYKSKTDGQSPDVELPLKLMVIGDFTGGSDTPLDEREVTSISKTNFNQVLQRVGVQTNFNVKNILSSDSE